MHPRAFRSLLQASIFSILCLSPLLAIGGQQSSNPVTLRMKYPLGAAHKYRDTMKLNMTLQVPGQSMTQTKATTSDAVVREKVTKLLPNGGAQVTSLTLSEKDTDDGKPVPSKPNKTPDVDSFSARGEVLSRKGLTPANLHTELLTGANAFLAMLLTSGILPQQPVKPGDTWTQTISLPDMPGIGSATIASHFVKTEQIGAYQTALIHTQVTIPLSLMLDANDKPTTRADQAVSTGTGTATGRFDQNFAMRQGFTVRLRGEGAIDNMFRIQMQPNSPPFQGQTKIKVTLGRDLIP